jgi:hypothetical protein
VTRDEHRAALLGYLEIFDPEPMTREEIADALVELRCEIDELKVFVSGRLAALIAPQDPGATIPT